MAPPPGVPFVYEARRETEWDGQSRALPPFVLKEIANFFSNYKVLQDVVVEEGEHHSREEALGIIRECREKYAEQQ